MSVEVQSPSNEYIANGINTDFPFTFKVLQDSHLKVYFDSVLQSSGYEVHYNVDGTGWIHTITALPPTNGVLIRLARSVPKSRSIDYALTGSFNANTLDDDIDRVVMMVQDLELNSVSTNPSGQIDAKNKRVVNVDTPINPTDGSNKLYVDQVVTQLGNLTIPNNPADNNKFLKANSGAATWQALTTSDISTTLGYTPANKAGDTFTGPVTLNGTVTASQPLTSTSSIQGTTITGTTDVISVTKPVGNNSTSVATTEYVNRASAGGGYTKTFGGSAKNQYFQCIVINNRVFISGLLTYQIGNMPTPGIRQTARKTFAELMFNVQPPAGTTISKVTTSHNSIYVLLSNGWLYSFVYDNTHGLAGNGSTALVGCLTRIEYFVTNSLTVTNIWTTNYVYNDGAAGEPMASCWAGCSNGALYGWGNNGNGNLGIGNTTTPILTPTLVSGISNVIMLSAGSGAGAHVLAVSSNSPKSVYTWGYNIGGACGSGNTTDQLTPTLRYTDPTFDIQDVKAHGSLNWSGAAWTQYGQNSYILVNGTLKVCGTNVFGQLGQGNTTNLTTFTSVAGQSNITKMDNTEGSAATSYILKSDNTLWACGFGNFGQFGDGTTAQKNTYTQIQTGVSDFWCSGSSSAGTLFFKKTDGSFWGCGWNRYGQLCNALTEADVNSTAVRIPLPIGRTVSQVRFFTNGILIGAVGPWSGTAQAITQENAYTGVLAVILDDGTLLCGGYNAENLLSTGAELYAGQSPNTLAAYTRQNYLSQPILPYQ